MNEEQKKLFDDYFWEADCEALENLFFKKRKIISLIAEREALNI